VDVQFGDAHGTAYIAQGRADDSSAACNAGDFVAVWGMNYFWIALGGALGSVARFSLGGAVARWAGQAFIGTLSVNVTGCFAIGVLAALGLAKPWENLFLVGLLGGFTTFSSFSLQTLQLVHEGRAATALVNVAASVLLCLAAVWLGHACGAGLRR
jgi:CrcB protein